VSAVIGASVGFVSTYPPTQCGLATFTRALLTSMVEADPMRRVGVVQVLERATSTPPDELVIERWVHGDVASLRRAATALESFEAVVLQHEYGIFGGADGDEVLALLRQCGPPVITVLHTVLPAPTIGQRRVLEEVCRLSSRVVVMTEAAKHRLHDVYHVDHHKTVVIPHGAPAPTRRMIPSPDGRPFVLTWGLIGPGKGLENAIESMRAVSDLVPLPRYVIAGETHPKVKAASGEAYRESLIARVEAAGLGGIVEFDDTYRDLPALNELVAECDLVLLPYESREQVTSGVLVEAVAAGKPVVATAFPHAVELLSRGPGVSVPHDDPAALGRAVRRVLTDPEVSARMHRAALRVGPELHWSAVAGRFGELIELLVPVRADAAVA
jgi:glycosyltransferase involved in cell wall biosynthesis